MSFKYNVISVGVLFIYAHGGVSLDFKYHNYDNLTAVLHNITNSYHWLSPNIYSIGTSINKRSLWVVAVGGLSKTKSNFPNVKLVGNIHGNEAVGREILLHFLEYLGDNYRKDPDVTWILDNTRIHVLPSMNPDGFEKANEGICTGDHGRGNAASFDLNRNFPDYYMNNPSRTQPEAAAIQNWMTKTPFILSASLHGGALVANYPFDSVREMKWETLLRQLKETDDPQEEQNLRDEYIASMRVNPPSIAPDDDVFIHLASVYSNKHPTMHQGIECSKDIGSFNQGITNGAAWYPLVGGMQDYNYFAHGCLELTLEISCCKYPLASNLPELWLANRDSLLELIKQAHMGVAGTVVDSTTGKPVAWAVLKITGREMNFTTWEDGEFRRILLPGKYELQVNATGYHPHRVTFQVLNYTGDYPQPTIFEVRLINTSYELPTTTQPTTSTILETSTASLPPLVLPTSRKSEKLSSENHSQQAHNQKRENNVIIPRISELTSDDYSCGDTLRLSRILVVALFVTFHFGT